MTRWWQGAFWIGLYLALTVAPLAVLWVGEPPPGRGFWSEFSAALAFEGMAMLGLQFALTARFRRIAAPYGIDIILQFHRQISLVAGGMILTHPLIVFLVDPGTLGLLNPFTAPWRARAGVLALLGLLLIIGLSLGRKQLGMRYETWRLSHGILAIAVVLLALAHVLGVGHYVQLPWKRALWDFMTLGTIALLLYIRVAKPLMMLRRPYTVAEVIPEHGRSWTLVLRPVGHGGLPFLPGQFAWLTLGKSPFGIEEHPFSFSSSALHPERPQLTIKALGDFTATIQHVQPGTRAYLDGPYGAFTPDRHDGPGYAYIAGGVGITPIISMLRTFADQGDRRPHLLIYASKSWDQVTFREELEMLGERLDLTVVHVLDQAPEGWTGEKGFITPELLARHLPPERCGLQYFLCGPPPLMFAVERDLRDVGVPLERIHMERFNLV